MGNPLEGRILASGEEDESVSSILLQALQKGRTQQELTFRDIIRLFEEQRDFSRTPGKELIPVAGFKVTLEADKIQILAPYSVDGRVYRIRSEAKIDEEGYFTDKETFVSRAPGETHKKVEDFFHDDLSFTSIIRTTVAVATDGRAEVNDLFLSERGHIVLSLVPLTELPK
jgi:hypothetical protein